MYKLIYDYIGEDSMDCCYGIEETFDTWDEAVEAETCYKQSVDCCHFTIVCCNEA